MNPIPPGRALPPAYRAPNPRLHGEGLTGERGAPYLADPRLIAAANIALELGAPLLLTGEAGCGKTDFAYAAARTLDEVTGEPLLCMVRSETRARDLLYHYDAVARFADAQAHGDEGREARERARSPGPYLGLEALGTALTSAKRRVVLIDEIDKAPRDLPNDLLRELDKWRFRVQELPEKATWGALAWEMGLPGGAPKPFVVITSNVERQLPEPFLRRCVFFHIPFPTQTQLHEIVKRALEADAPKDDLRRSPARLERLTEVLIALRDVPNLVKAPGTAELLQWERALWAVYQDPAVTTRLGPKGTPPVWRDLPGLECLLKLREDLELVGVGGGTR